MPDQSQNPSPNQNVPQETATERNPTVRTMKSDLEELTGKTKRPPELAAAEEILKKSQAYKLAIETEGHRSSFAKNHEGGNKKRFILLAGAIILLLVLGAGFYLLMAGGNKESIPHTPTPAVAPLPQLFATETSETITIKTGDGPGLLRSLQELTDKEGREGTLKRVAIKISGGPTERLLGLTDFFETLGIEPPSGFVGHMETQIMIFVFYGSEGGRVGLAVKTNDINRALRDLFVWEPTMVSSLGSLLFDKERDLTEGKFEDRIYRNIDWRFLKLSSKEDLGIAYTVFPANNILILTTSKTALETIINRLFDLR